MRPNVGNPAQAAKTPEAIDIRKLFTRINTLYDSGRLQESLGEQGADDLLEHVNNHLIEHKKILRNQAVAKDCCQICRLRRCERGRRKRFHTLIQ
jgi:hypothetical protein